MPSPLFCSRCLCAVLANRGSRLEAHAHSKLNFPRVVDLPI